MAVLDTLFRSHTGETPESTDELPSSGSNRKYYRMSSRHFTLMGVSGTSPEENRAFVYLAEHFKEKGLPVPEVYGHSADWLCYLQEDLGDTLLFQAIECGRMRGVVNEEERGLLHKTIALLPAIQCKGAEGLDFGRCYPLAAFNERAVSWDLNYFKYCFLKTTGIEFNENRLEDDFRKLTALLLEDCSDTFMYRDFQSRNVMIKNGEPYFIDFQGGRKGPVYYDVASFLWQAKARYPAALREELLTTYLQALGKFMPVNEAQFRSRLKHFVLFRTLQVLGAYGFRGYFEKKPHFIESIPFALDNLRALLQEAPAEYPYLCTLLKEVAGTQPVPIQAGGPGLEVEVYSFSYKKGIPADPSGNGGGFVFDCRAVHNPGKYDRYKPLTGLDEPVIRFLEEDGEIAVFLESVYALVDAAVKRYLKRGFTHLTVCFGCTGGRHRSVYSAQHLAERLHAQFGIRVRLIHREQKIEQLFEPFI
ncbi:MAG: phosphotransferase [Parabacteroides sp.]|nr:phosphotransferase [Parabacteroides sp.]